MSDFFTSDDVGTGGDDSNSYLDDFANSNASGAVAYSADNYVDATTGGVINSVSNPLNAPADASGGNGSYLSSLQDTLTNGLSDSLVSAFDFGIGSLVDRYTVNANARVSPASAPAASISLSRGALSKVLLFGGAALVVYLLIKKA